MLGMTPTSLRIGRQGRTRMLTLRGISSTVLTVRLDTKCCIVMFATTGHHFRSLVGPLSMSFGVPSCAGGQVALPRLEAAG